MILCKYIVHKQYVTDLCKLLVICSVNLVIFPPIYSLHFAKVT